MSRTDALAILVMALATYATRAGGILLAERLPDGPRTQRLLTHLSTSIVAAILAPVLLHGDTALRLGVAAAAVVVLLSRQALIGMAVAVLTTAIFRT